MYKLNSKRKVAIVDKRIQTRSVDVAECSIRHSDGVCAHCHFRKILATNASGLALFRDLYIQILISNVSCEHRSHTALKNVFKTFPNPLPHTVQAILGLSVERRDLSTSVPTIQKHELLKPAAITGKKFKERSSTRHATSSHVIIFSTKVTSVDRMPSSEQLAHRHAQQQQTQAVSVRPSASSRKCPDARGRAGREVVGEVDRNDRHHRAGVGGRGWGLGAASSRGPCYCVSCPLQAMPGHPCPQGFFSSRRADRWCSW